MEQRFHPQQEAPAPTEVESRLLPLENATDGEEVTTDVESEALADAAATSLTALLQQEAVSQRNETLSSFVWSGAYIAFMLWLIQQAGTTEAALKVNLLFCFALMAVIGRVGCFRLSRRMHRRKSSLTEALSHINAKTQVAPLIRTLRVQNTPVRNLAKHRLIALLPTLRASDASLLGEAERKILVRQLAIFPNDPGPRDLRELFSRSAFRREMDMRLAILTALEQVGGEQELTVVERLARGLPTLHSQLKVPDELREAAKTCLPYLQSRATDQRASAQLLRASDLPNAAAADLLRPAAMGAPTHSEQLLRASEPQS
ncbi:MAG: hypothetical protein JWL77_681 [Chthonomonadaceae bacterium]|nr:hypothetical protein [Chthonomonadaceae bacterium]